jgi:hypothetical protein
MRRGRPPTAETRGPLTSVTFKADKETVAAIEVLTNDLRAYQRALVGDRSAAIRRALIESAERILIEKGKR